MAMNESHTHESIGKCISLYKHEHMHMTQWRSHTPINSDSEWIFFTSTSKHEIRIHRHSDKETMLKRPITITTTTAVVIVAVTGAETATENISLILMSVCAWISIWQRCSQECFVWSCLCACVVTWACVCMRERSDRIFVYSHCSWCTFVVRVGVL